MKNKPHPPQIPEEEITPACIYKSPKIVFIIGSVRSGSTLLEMLISEHRQGTAIGELTQLNHCWNSKKDRCLCGQDYVSCPFWRTAQQDTGLDFSKTATSIRKDWITKFVLLMPPKAGRVLLNLFASYPSLQWNRSVIKNNFKMLTAIFNRQNSSFIVDSSKYPSLFKFYHLLYPENFCAIIIKRDGRAVINSIRKRGLSRTKAVFSWIRTTLNTMLIIGTVPKLRLHTLHYEQLCTHLDSEMNSIWSFLNVPPMILSPVIHKQGKHSIAGSPTIKRLTGRTIDIKLDTSWKKDLSPREIKYFNIFLGWLNWLNGYPK